MKGVRGREGEKQAVMESVSKATHNETQRRKHKNSHLLFLSGLGRSGTLLWEGGNRLLGEQQRESRRERERDREKKSGISMREWGKDKIAQRSHLLVLWSGLRGSLSSLVGGWVRLAPDEQLSGDGERL